MIQKFTLIFFLVSVVSLGQQHCGYDFTSYIVLHVHEDGKKENISGLNITLVDSTGAAAVNTLNRYSWNHKDEVLRFSENYQIDAKGNRVEAESQEGLRWNFPYAKQVYLLSVTNEFPADVMKVRIEDPKNRYKPTEVQLYAWNMYILCTSQAQQQAMQFGPRQNRPVKIALQRK